MSGSLVDEPFAWPKNLTFPEPVTWWDDHFVEIEDASYCCTACADEFDGTAANAR